MTAEINDYESHAGLMSKGESISFPVATALLRQEPVANKRHELALRCAEVIKGIQDLRAERLQKLHENAQECGGENYLALYQNLHALAYEKLAAQAQPFLAQTESKFVAALAPLLVREANVSLDEATRADLGYFQRLQRFDQHFPTWQQTNVYRETFSGLGIFTYKQENIVLDNTPRPHKSTKSNHFPIRVPDEIKVVFTLGHGIRKFSSFLHETGRAQHFAWMSRQLHPEFHYCGDPAVSEGFALLLASCRMRHGGWLIYSAFTKARSYAIVSLCKSCCAFAVL